MYSLNERSGNEEKEDEANMKFLAALRMFKNMIVIIVMIIWRGD
jgi:hypothetical protein